MDEWTVAVVGAGPAGAAAALAVLQRQPAARVLLIDREEHPRDKACGDGIAAHVFEVLDRFGLAHIADDYTPVTELTMASREVSAHRALQQQLRVVPRTVFDARLAAAAVDRGAVFLRHTVKTVEVRGSTVILDGCIAARCVVAADGAESAVRRQLGHPLNGNGHMAVAIRGYAPTALTAAALVARGRDWPAYAWRFPIGDGRANVGYGEVLRRGKTLSKAVLLDRLDELLPGASHDAVQWRAARLPLTTSRPRQPDGPVLLVGDAASLVNPMSGEGIYYAVLSGVLAGRAAASGAADPGRLYRSRLRAELGRHIRHTTVMATAGAVGSLASVGVRMVAADPAFFDDQVKVSIAGGLYRPAVAVRAFGRALATRPLSRSRRRAQKEAAAS